MQHENLTEEEVAKIKQVMVKISECAEIVKIDPFDPKIEAMLEITFEMLNEQLMMDKKYVCSKANKDDTFLIKDSDIPSVDDLKEMLGEGGDSDST